MDVAVHVFTTSILTSELKCQLLRCVEERGKFVMYSVQCIVGYSDTPHIGFDATLSVLQCDFQLEEKGREG